MDNKALWLLTARSLREPEREYIKCSFEVENSLEETIKKTQNILPENTHFVHIKLSRAAIEDQTYIPAYTFANDEVCMTIGWPEVEPPACSKTKFDVIRKRCIAHPVIVPQYDTDEYAKVSLLESGPLVDIEHRFRLKNRRSITERDFKLSDSELPKKIERVLIER